VVPLDLGGEVGRSRPFPFCAVDTTEEVVTCDTLLTLNPIDAEIGEEQQSQGFIYFVHFETGLLLCLFLLNIFAKSIWGTFCTCNVGGATSEFPESFAVDRITWAGSE
jgi:hypothetical protein